MTVESFLDAVLDGSATTRGLYWGMDSGAQLWLRQFLAHDGQLPRDCEKAPFNLWIAPNGHTEQLHYDAHPNLHITLHGIKVWRLFAPWHKLKGSSSVISPCPAGVRYQ